MEPKPNPNPPNPELGPSVEAAAPRRFGYFLNKDPVAVIDTFEMYSDRLTAFADRMGVNYDPEDYQGKHEFHEVEDVWTVLSEELLEFAKAYPRRAAELVAEILRRDDHHGNFHLPIGSAEAVMYIAAADHELGTQMWAMFRELSPESVDEAVVRMWGTVDPRISHEPSREAYDIEKLRRRIENENVDRVAMMLFYVEHVKPYEE